MVRPGETVEIEVSASDPFQEAQPLVTGTDIVWNTAVTLNRTFSRTSGQSITVRLTAVGGTAVITYMQVRARPVQVVRSTKISQRDTASISQHGEKSYPDTAPWVGVHDALAVVSKVVYRYSQRRPIVQLRLSSEDPAHYGQVLSRTVSDRIKIINDEMGLNSDFFVERVDHIISRIWDNKPPVHAVVLGCEKEPDDVPANPFTFDKRGAGFDEGVFDPLSSDQPDEVFIFDHPVQGQFDLGEFGT